MNPQIEDEYFRLLVQYSFDVITIVDCNGKIVYASPSMERVLGFPPANLVGQNAFDLIHPEDIQTVHSAFVSVVCRTNHHNPTEFRARRSDGAWVYLEAMGNNLLVRPEIEGIVLNLREITERKQAESHLQQLHAELTQAYDATLEGWSRTLDLRDKETEGHTRRVTQATLHLAASLGLPPADLVHIRRGALLHDIGKIGIPDTILFKAGKLSPQEWTIMRRHPVYAYEILAPIPFLQPALDIPYCHHEKWDGSGYPRGLAGDQIPLAARLFAVIDVWDALRSNRPYRPAWDNDQALAYIRDQSGRHFDPEVVHSFLGSFDHFIQI